MSELKLSDTVTNDSAQTEVTAGKGKGEKTQRLSANTGVIAGVLALSLLSLSTPL